jgi:reverse gyrase
MEVIYSNLCPVCDGDLHTHEIEAVLCNSKGKELCRLDVDEVAEEFFSFFRNCVGEPRAIQRMWAKRILRGESFAATAPTGVGKTSFGTAMSLFLALKGKRCYLILPTSLLVNQCVDNLRSYSDKLGIKTAFNFEDSKNEEDSIIGIGFYHGRLKKDQKEKFFENIEKYSILITTTQFLSRNFNHLKNMMFDFIFVDDVDSILKASKNVDRILQLLGFYWDNGWKGEARGCLMVSTATAKKGKKAELFRKLLNFDIGSSRFTVRNIEDVAVRNESIETISKIMQLLGSGGLIYARTIEEAEKIHEILKDKFKIGLVSATTGKSTENFKKFAVGELDYLIGTAHYYGALIRGLDLPERIRFVIFTGCPVFRIRMDDIDNLSPGMIRILALIYRNNEKIGRFLPILNKLESKPDVVEELRKILKDLIKRGDERAGDVVVREREVIFPDIRTYIQGSGRTSRLFAGGITRGASFLLENDVEVLNAFIQRSKYYDIEFKDLSEVNFEKLRRELDESRERYTRKTEFDVIKPALFIVESPTKARQISRFFGKPSIKVADGVVVYEIPMEKYLLLVTASIGHITDLITNRGFHGVELNERFVPVYASIKRCRNCNHQFTENRDSCPKCGSEDIDDSKKRIEVMRKLAHDTELVIIGTDPDTEGEKIAWDLRNLLSGCGSIKRAEFHEVTKRAVSQALENRCDINENYVKAQMVRRIEDRWIGFVLSQKLWDVFGNRNLSAGRAQTPVLGWIIDRYRISKKRKSIAIIRDLDLVLECDKRNLEIEIALIEERKEKRIPLPPYTTDSLLRDANQILKISAKEAMQLAQDLFENGLITYHRTDSTRVSEVGLRIAKDYLGDDFEGRDWHTEGAHECIRPTRAVDRDTLQRLIHENVINVEGLNWRHFALYDIIFRRFMASQCKSYEIWVRKYRITYDGREVEEERVINASGRAFELYRSVWIRKELPEGKIKVTAEIRKVPEAPLYTQSEIVQMMREKGIGRPSTFATIIDRLFIRNYIVEKNGRIFPTKLGERVYSYLSQNYASFVSEDRTRILEEKMDAVERGEIDWYDALQELFDEIRGIM